MSEQEREEDQDLATTKKPHLDKLCPLLIIAGHAELTHFHLNGYCLKKSCALWVEGHKDTVLPQYYLIHEGCGLIANIFWERRLRSPKIEKR